MSNPFDQFDSAPPNPFDRFDGTSPPPAGATGEAPKDEAQPGFFSQAASRLGEGMTSEGAALGATAIMHDMAPAASAAVIAHHFANQAAPVDAGRKAYETEGEAARHQLGEDWKSGDYLGAAADVGSVLGTYIRHPKQTALGAIEGLPGMVPMLGGMEGGAAAGSAAGAAATAPFAALSGPAAPVVEAAGTGLGAVAGAFGGGTAAQVPFSYGQWVLQRMAEEGKKRGLDLTKPEDVAALAADPTFNKPVKAEASRFGLTDSAAQTAVAMMGGKLLGLGTRLAMPVVTDAAGKALLDSAGKVVTKPLTKSGIAKIATAGAGDIALQAAGFGVGGEEARAQATGEGFSPERAAIGAASSLGPALVFTAHGAIKGAHGEQAPKGAASQSGEEKPAAAPPSGFTAAQDDDGSWGVKGPDGAWVDSQRFSDPHAAQAAADIHAEGKQGQTVPLLPAPAPQRALPAPDTGLWGGREPGTGFNMKEAPPEGAIPVQGENGQGFILGQTPAAPPVHPDLAQMIAGKAPGDEVSFGDTKRATGLKAKADITQARQDAVDAGLLTLNGDGKTVVAPRHPAPGTEAAPGFDPATGNVAVRADNGQGAVIKDEPNAEAAEADAAALNGGTPAPRRRPLGGNDQWEGFGQPDFTGWGDHPAPGRRLPEASPPVPPPEEGAPPPEPQARTPGEPAAVPMPEPAAPLPAVPPVPGHEAALPLAASAPNAAPAQAGQVAEAPSPAAPAPVPPPAEPPPSSTPPSLEAAMARYHAAIAALQDTDEGTPAHRQAVAEFQEAESAYQAAQAQAEAGKRHAPVDIKTESDLEAASQPVDTEPSPAQIEAGNYAKGHGKIGADDQGRGGIPVTIENPKGSVRRGTSPDGTPWEVELPAAYGYFKGTEGADGDHVDTFIGPNPASPVAYAVDQVDPATGAFDENKILTGFDSPEQAVAAYDAAFSDGSGPSRRAAVTAMTIPELKGWLKDGDTKAPIAPQFAPRRALEQAVSAMAPGSAFNVQTAVQALSASGLKVAPKTIKAELERLAGSGALERTGKSYRVPGTAPAREPATKTPAPPPGAAEAATGETPGPETFPVEPGKQIGPRAGTPKSILAMNGDEPGVVAGSYLGTGHLVLNRDVVPAWDRVIRASNPKTLPADRVNHLLDQADAAHAQPIRWLFGHRMAAKEGRGAAVDEVVGRLPSGRLVAIDARILDFLRKQGIEVRATAEKGPWALIKDGTEVGIVSPRDLDGEAGRRVAVEALAGQQTAENPQVPVSVAGGSQDHLSGVNTVKEATSSAATSSQAQDGYHGFLSGLTPMKAGAAKNALDRLVRFSDSGVMSKKQRVESLYDAGALSVRTIEEPKIKPMSRRQFNNATQQEQDAHARRMKEAGTETTYLVNDSDLGKTAYEYAQHLLAQKETKHPSQQDAAGTAAAEAERLHETPVSQLSEEDSRKELSALHSALGADYGYASRNIRPGSEESNLLHARLAELREKLGQMPWQRSQAEAKSGMDMPAERHRRVVEEALAAGKNVPAEVRAVYPDLISPDEQAGLDHLLQRSGETGLFTPEKLVRRATGQLVVVGKNKDGSPRAYTVLLDPEGKHPLSERLMSVPVPKADEATTLRDYRVVRSADTAPVARPEEMNRQRAENAYRWNSMTPEKRAQEDQESFARAVNDLYAKMLPLAETETQKAILEREIRRYKQGYLDKYGAVLDARSKTASTMVTGGSNFPVERNRKAMVVERKRIADFQDWDKRAQAAIERALTDAMTPEKRIAEAWGRLQHTMLSDITTVRQIDMGKMKGFSRVAFTNSIAGKIERLAENGEVDLVNRALDYLRQQQQGMDKPLFTKANKVWGMAEVAEKNAKAKGERPTGMETVAEYHGAKIVNNHDEDRVQILLAEKSSQELSAALKKEGWHWSPRNKAWQRKTTNAALHSARRIVESAGFKAPEEHGAVPQGAKAEESPPAMEETATPQAAQTEESAPTDTETEGARAESILSKLPDTVQTMVKNAVGVSKIPMGNWRIKDFEIERLSPEVRVQLRDALGMGNRGPNAVIADKLNDLVIQPIHQMTEVDEDAAARYGHKTAAQRVANRERQEENNRREYRLNLVLKAPDPKGGTPEALAEDGGRFVAGDGMVSNGHIMLREGVVPEFDAAIHANGPGGEAESIPEGGAARVMGQAEESAQRGADIDWLFPMMTRKKDSARIVGRLPDGTLLGITPVQFDFLRRQGFSLKALDDKSPMAVLDRDGAVVGALSPAPVEMTAAMADEMAETARGLNRVPDMNPPEAKPVRTKRAPKPGTPAALRAESKQRAIDSFDTAIAEVTRKAAEGADPAYKDVHDSLEKVAETVAKRDDLSKDQKAAYLDGLYGRDLGESSPIDAKTKRAHKDGQESAHAFWSGWGGHIENVPVEIDTTTGAKTRYTLPANPVRIAEVRDRVGRLPTAQFSAAPTGWGEVEGGADNLPSREETIAAITRAWDEMGLPRENGLLADRLFGEGESLTNSGAESADRKSVAGVALGRVAALSLEAMDPTATAFHEGFHILEHAGAVRPDEIALMERENEKLRRLVAAHVPGIDAEALTPKEVRAYGFEAYRKAKAEGKPVGMLPRLIREAYDRVALFFSRLGNALRGMGFRTSEDVYRAITEEKRGQRVAAAPEEAQALMDRLNSGEGSFGANYSAGPVDQGTRTPTAFRRVFPARDTADLKHLGDKDFARVVHEPIGPRQSGELRSSYAEAVERPWLVRTPATKGRSFTNRFATEDEANRAAASLSPHADEVAAWKMVKEHGGASGIFDALAEELRRRGFDARLNNSKTTTSRYISVPEAGVELRWADHSKFAPSGAVDRAHTATTWEFSPKGSKADLVSKYASALSRLDEIRRQRNTAAGPVDQLPPVITRQSEAHSDARDEVLWRGAEDGNEHNAFVDTNGKTRFETSGEQDFSAFSPETVDRLNDAAESITIHHNHPGGGGLSMTDIVNLAYPGVRAIVAHTHSGESSAAWLTAEGRNLLGRLPAGTVDGYLTKIYQDAWDAAEKVIGRREGGRNTDVREIVNRALDSVGLIHYESGHALDVPKGTADLARNASITAARNTLAGFERRNPRAVEILDQPSAVDRPEAAGGFHRQDEDAGPGRRRREGRDLGSRTRVGASGEASSFPSLEEARDRGRAFQEGTDGLEHRLADLSISLESADGRAVVENGPKGTSGTDDTERAAFAQRLRDFADEVTRSLPEERRRAFSKALVEQYRLDALKATSDKAGLNRLEAPERALAERWMAMAKEAGRHRMTMPDLRAPRRVPPPPAAPPSVETINRHLDDVLKALSPTSRGLLAKATERIFRKNLAERAQKDAMVEDRFQQFRRLVNGLDEEQRWRFLDNIEEGRPQDTPELRQVDAVYRRLEEHFRSQIQSLGTGHLDHFLENYVRHYWQDPRQAEAVEAQMQKQAALAHGRRPLEGSKAWQRQRTIRTYREGMEKGLKPLYSDPLTIMVNQFADLNKFYHAQLLKRQLVESGLVRFERSLRVPAGERAIDDKMFRAMTPITNEIGQRVGGMEIHGQWVAPEPVARLVNNYLSAGLHGRSAIYDSLREAGNTLNMVQLGLSAFHATFASIDTMISRMALGLMQASRGEFGEAGKNVLGAFNPLTVKRSFDRGKALEAAYLHPGTVRGVEAEVARMFVEGGGRKSMDHFWNASATHDFFQSWKNGSLFRDVLETLRGDRDLTYQGAGDIPKLAANIPWTVLTGAARLAARTAQTVSHPLMQALVPRLKMGVFADLTEDYLRSHPNASDVERADFAIKAWDSVENRLGQMTYDNLFWHRVQKDLAFIMIRSVGWNLGTIRELGGGVLDTVRALRDLKAGKPSEMTTRMAYAMAMPLVVGTLGAMMNYAFTGQAPQDWRDYFFPRTGRPIGGEAGNAPERLIIPSYIKDVLEYSSAPLQTLLNKQNPLVSSATELYQNKDYYGGAIYNQDDPAAKRLMEIGEWAFGQYAPFSARGMAHLAGTHTPAGIEALSFFGFQPAPAAIADPERVALIKWQENHRDWQRRQSREAAEAFREKGAEAAVQVLREAGRSQRSIKATMRNLQSPQRRRQQLERAYRRAHPGEDQ